MFFVDFRQYNVCVCFTSNENCHFFFRKNDYSPKRVVDVPRARDIFRNKIMEIVKGFDDKCYHNNNNSKPWKSSAILRVNPNFIIFFFFIIFLLFSFFSIFHFFQFFIFLHFLSFFFHFLYVLSFFVGCSKSDFFGVSISSRFLLTFSCKKKCWGPSRGVPLWPLFSFFSSFFLQFCLS